MKLKRKFFLPKFLKEMKKLQIGGITGGNRIKLIINGDQCFDEFLLAIRRAKKNINLESYIFNSDNVGWMIARELAKASLRGVEVNVLYDAVGCIKTNPNIFDFLKKNKIVVIAHNPAVPWRLLWNISFRDHRKILIIDGKTAFVGGINIGDEYAGKKFKGLGWRDTHMKIDGPAVKEIQFFFIENWIRNGGLISDYGRYFVSTKDVGDIPVMILSTKGRKKITPIQESYLSAIRHAKKNIMITNAYFIPDRKIYTALMTSAKNGVNVMLILPGKSDLPFVKLAGRFLYKRYLKNGIRVFEYQKSVLHAKTAVIDGVVSTIGSSNLDRRSFKSNLELNVLIIDQQFGNKMESVFSQDLKNCLEITKMHLDRRTILEYLIEWICYRFRNLL